MKGKALLYVLALCLALAQGAGALAQGYTLEGTGLRLYAPEGWQVITAQNANDYKAALEAMGTSPETVQDVFSAGDARALIYAQAMEARLVMGPACGVDSVWQADDNAKAAVLATARGAYPALAGDWIMPDWIRLEGASTLGAMTVYQDVWVTCHYGRLWALEATRYGEAFTQEQNTQVAQLAQSLVVLGTAAGGAKDAAIPQVTLPAHSGTAQVRVSRDETPITLDNPYEEVVSSFVLTGVTTPNADLRYYVDGAGVARFKSDEDGRFEVEIQNLKRGKNSIRIQSISNAGYGAVVFTCQYTPATAPVVLGAMDEKTSLETYPVKGRALPGSKATLIRGTRMVDSVTADEAGLFTLQAPLDKEKKYEFTLRVEHDDYRKTEVKFDLTRIPSLQAQAVKVDPKKIKKDPGAYKDAVALLTGQITGMGNSAQTGPYLILDDTYLVLTDHLNGIQEGPAEALIRLNGQVIQGLYGAQLIQLN